MKTTKWAIFTLVLAIVFLGVAATLHAQWTEGTITGTVTDPTGAAVQGAKVVVTSQATGLSREFETDAIGYYRVPHLRPGKYAVRVEASGFKTSLVKDVEVLVNVITRTDAQLELGAVAETVEVVGGTGLVQTEEARLADTYNRRLVEELPLEGRDIYRLALLQPGVTATNAPVVSNTSFNRFENSFIANGASVRGNNFVLDGASNNNEWLGGTPAITPSVDAIEEFQVQTLNFSAEYGRNNGSVMNIITKSGTNELHGSLYWFHRNDAVDARSFFDAEKPAPLLQHQFGASVGGPIRKNRTFFFFNYEGTRNKRGTTQLRSTETPEFRELVRTTRPGSLAEQFFADFPGPGCIAGTSTDRGSIPAPTASPFAVGPRDGIPDSCIGRFVRPQRRESDQYLIRIDHNFSDKDRLSVRWLGDDREADISLEQLIDRSVRGFRADLVGNFADLNLAYTHIFSPTFLNDFRFAYGRSDFENKFVVPPSRTLDILKGIGKPDFFGTLSFGDGTARIGNSFFIPREFTFNIFTLSNVTTTIRGAHTLKYGVEIRHIQENSDYQLLTRPLYIFNSIFNFANDNPWLGTGLVNRDPSSPQFGQFTGSPRHFRWTHWGWFIQHDWKARRNLTLNLGLRYEIFGDPSERDGILANIIPGPGRDFLERIKNGRVDRVSRLLKVDFNNFAPRIGLAWDPRGDGKMSVRTGLAVAYLEPYSNLWSNGSRFNPPDATWVDVFPFFGVGTDINYRFPFQPSPDASGPPSPTNGVPGTVFTPEGVDENLRTAYSTQWFLSLQRELPGNYSVTANYVGTRGVKLYIREDWNRVRGDILDFSEDRLQSEWGQIWLVDNSSDSIYHGANLQVRKAYSRGFQFVANYTFGKGIDTPTTDGGLGDFQNVSGHASLYTGAQDIQNRRADRAPSEFDVRHRFTFNTIWDLPSPKGASPWMNKLLGGWQANGIVSLQTARPFTVVCTRFWFAGCDFNLDGNTSDRPNDPGLRRSGYSRQQLVNGTFTIPDFCPGGLVPFFAGTPCVPAGTNGNLGRNTFRGPGFAAVDLSFFKNTRFDERYNLQFRWEVFNLFNRVNLWNPNSDMAVTALFGKSTAAFPGRQMQFALKLLF